MLKDQDLAMLKSYESARDLTVSLLQEWLVKYKFKNWSSHKTHDIGAPVTEGERKERAKEVARVLGDNKMWHSHGRSISLQTLKDILKLEIEFSSIANVDDLTTKNPSLSLITMFPLSK